MTPEERNAVIEECALAASPRRRRPRVTLGNPLNDGGLAQRQANNAFHTRLQIAEKIRSLKSN